MTADFSFFSPYTYADLQSQINSIETGLETSDVQGLDPSVVGLGGITNPVIGYAYVELTGPVSTSGAGMIPVPGLEVIAPANGLYVMFFSGTGWVDTPGAIAKFGLFAGSGAPPIPGSFRQVQHVEYTPFTCVGVKSPILAGDPVQARFGRVGGGLVTAHIEEGCLTIVQVA